MTISFNGGALSTWTFAFAAPFDGTLMPGANENATRWPFQSPTAPGLDAFGAGRGCNTLTGRFVVLYAVYGPSGDVASFGADFEQHCEGAAPALFGQIRFQTFYLAFTLGGVLASTDVHLYFVCSTDFAPVVGGLNTLLLSAPATQGPDVIALAATIGGDGIVNVPGATGTGFFAVATVNVGASGTITASADTGSASLPVSIALSQTFPLTGLCQADSASSVITQINANATPTFAIFVTGTGTVPFDPANNRIFVRFKDAGGVTRGATSVAVRTQ